MSRPIKIRKVKSYARDIESLGRLRTAIQMDGSLDGRAVTRAMQKIDETIRCLIELSNSVVQKSA